MIKQIYQIAVRECDIIRHNPIYAFCMVVFPVLVIVFFTSLMTEGQPVNMPVGVVDQDNTATTRALIRRLDAFQTSHVAAHYANMNDARRAVQQGDIYAFLLIPKGTTDGMVSSRQPKISFYYSSVTLLAGSTLFKDLKTICTLASAAVGSAKLSALGKTPDEIQTFLQPIAIDMHMIGNPWANYNVYLSTIMVPGLLLLFVFLITPYSIGTELKFGRSKEWLSLANNNICVALAGKLLPHTLVFLSVFYGFEFYILHVLDFPHPGGVAPMLLNGFLAVVASQCFGVFVFGLMPSLRMSMSICSLWAVLSFSVCGATYPVFSMDSMLEAMAQLFPLRHYYMIYKISIFNDFPLTDCALNIGALVIFIALPILTVRNLRRAMLEYVYIP